MSLDLPSDRVALLLDCTRSLVSGARTHELRPGVIVMDVTIPVLDGIEVLATVQRAVGA